jgi:hypothetical protein
MMLVHWQYDTSAVLNLSSEKHAGKSKRNVQVATRCEGCVAMGSPLVSVLISHDLIQWASDLTITRPAGRLAAVAIALHISCGGICIKEVDNNIELTQLANTMVSTAKPAIAGGA